MEMKAVSTGTLTNNAVITSNLAKMRKFEWKVQVPIRHGLAYLGKKVMYVSNRNKELFIAVFTLSVDVHNIQEFVVFSFRLYQSYNAGFHKP
jgi:hypothetical protein